MSGCVRCAELYKVGGCLTHRLQRGEVSFQVNADLLYNFVEDRVTPNPIQIHSKRQYKQLLKEKGFTDQVGSKEPHRDLRKRPFDRKWDYTLDKAIDQSIAEVKKKPFNVVGKGLSHQEIRSVIKQDFQRQQKKKELVHA